MEHDEKLNAKQYDSDDENNLEWPALLSLWGRSGKYLTGSGPDGITGPSWVVGGHSAWSCKVSLGFYDSARLSNLV